jgi:PRC-barrel domain
MPHRTTPAFAATLCLAACLRPAIAAEASQFRLDLPREAVIEGPAEEDGAVGIPGSERFLPAQAMLDAAVSTDGGADDWGGVRDILVGPDGRVAAVLIETGGHLGIGAMIFSLPWTAVAYSDGFDRLLIDRERLDLAPYSIYGGIDVIDVEETDRIVRFEAGSARPGARLTPIGDILGCPLDEAPEDGIVTDMLIDPAGVVRRVVIAPPGAAEPTGERCRDRRGGFLGLLD